MDVSAVQQAKGDAASDSRPESNANPEKGGQRLLQRCGYRERSAGK